MIYLTGDMGESAWLAGRVVPLLAEEVLKGTQGDGGAIRRERVGGAERLQCRFQVGRHPDGENPFLRRGGRLGAAGFLLAHDG
jgi:hypothetical protein